MKLRWTMFFGIALTVIVILFPVAMAHVLQGNASWMGFISGYAGAIFGGVFGGLFTFASIYLTLNAQKNDRYLTEFPIKMKVADDLMRSIDGYRVHFPMSHYIQGEAQYKNEIEGISLLKRYCKEIVEQSILLSFEMYQEARAMESQVASIISRNFNKLSDFQVDEYGNYQGISVVSTEARRVMSVEALDKISAFRDVVFAYMRREYMKYDKLTGR